MTIRTLQIDPLTGDLKVSNNQLVLLSDGQAISQAIGSALKTLAGEWFLDSSVGVPYFDDVLVAHPDGGVLVNTFRKAILGVQGVQDVPVINLNFDPASRTLTVSWQATTNVGNLTGTVEVPIGG